MEIVMIKTSDLRPYKNNPRINDHAVDYVKRSIEEFGFKVPIVIDEHYTIITGHTRHKAAKQLGLDTVPCVIASDLTDEQIDAFRLVDNKASELATWDLDKLTDELKDLSVNFDISAFDFEIPAMFHTPEHDQEEDQEEEFERYYGDERERTAETYNLYDFDETDCSGFYQMPVIEKTDHTPTRLIGFNYVLNSDDFEAGVHFYLDDYQFERIWNNPHKYIDRLAEFDCVLTPDFSLYMNMPMAMKVWNTYRNRLIGQILQRYDITVIPCVSWAEPETFSFCFDGIEPGGTISVSTIGVKRDEDAYSIWKAGMDETLKRLKPKCIVIYGGKIDYDFQGTPVIYVENEVTNRWKED